jgi:hypothetical protein
VSRLRLFVLLLAATLATGCLEVDRRIVLRPDGSGSLTLRVTLDPSRRDEARERLARLVTGERVPPADARPMGATWMRTLAARAEDFRWRSLAEDADGTVRAQGRFLRLEDAARAGVFFSQDLRLERDRYGRWRLEAWAGWRDRVRERGEEIGGKPVAEVLAALETALEGLALSTTITFPTAVAETNARLEADGRTVTWRLDAARLARSEPGRVHVVLAPDPRLEDWLPFRHTVDDDLLARRLLEEPPPAGRWAEAAPRDAEGGE